MNSLIILDTENNYTILKYTHGLLENTQYWVIWMYNEDTNQGVRIGRYKSYVAAVRTIKKLPVPVEDIYSAK